MGADHGSGRGRSTRGSSGDPWFWRWPRGAGRAPSLVILAGLLALGGGVAGADSPGDVAAFPGADAFADTSIGVHVFDDQLPGSLSPGLLDFVAEHLDGSQKLPRSLVDELHARNPDFTVLQYRLGIGLGDRTAGPDCTPDGSPILVLDGDAWVPEWPADPDPAWFASAGPASRPHYLCDWGWVLVDTDHPGWRSWFADQVRDQVERTAADGLFLDSVSPPNQLGTWDPPLPGIDAVFEEAWSRRIHDWLGWLRDELDLPIIANAGAWVTSRDTTDYTPASGVMIEGFALPWPDVSTEDWALQMDRALSVTGRGGVLLAQAYPDPADVTARLFILASYLLVKGEHAFVDLEVAEEPTWFPEYDVPLGPAVDPLPPTIGALRHGEVYVRRFDEAIVVVNPSSHAATWRPPEGVPVARLTPVGGGSVPDDGVLPSSWRLRREPVLGALRLGAREAALLAIDEPGAGGQGGHRGQDAAGDQRLDDVQAVHRDGQTFLTWQERDDLSGETYRVYRSAALFASGALDETTMVAEVGEASARLWSERTLGPDGWSWRYLQWAVIEDGGHPLPERRGLLVWTPGADDLAGAASADAWYAVEVVGAGGEPAGSSLVGPIRETVADPMPIHVRDGAHGRSHLMLQYADLATWNPSFHAPHERNGWLGVDPGAPGVAQALAYAYTYVVAEPVPSQCPGGRVPDRLPVILDLHGWNGNDYPAHLGPSDWYCAIQIRPVDSSESWWFGFAETTDYRRGETPGPGDRIANFTERRVLRMLFDLLRDPDLGARVDEQRVYVYGHSMGGSGALALALRYPAVFAAAYASEPMTDMARSGDAGGVDWRPDVEWKWGHVADDLPVAIEAPGDWAATVARYAGTGVYTWQDHVSQIVARRGDEAVPFGVAHGTRDDVVAWPTQGVPFYPSLTASSRCVAGAVRDADHTWLGFDGLPATLAADASLVPFAGLRVIRDETVPGLGPDGAGPTWPPGGEVDVGTGIAWSASWDAWHGPPVDLENEWSMDLRAVDGSRHIVDVTPRRLQRFAVRPGLDYRWQVATPDGRTLRSGTISAGADGLLTVPDVPIDDVGVRVTITTPGACGLSPRAVPRLVVSGPLGAWAE